MKKSTVLAMVIALSAGYAADVYASGAKGSGARWGYEGSTGPANWGNLGYPTCSEGKNQSPVNISKSAPVNLDQIEFHYASTPIKSARLIRKRRLERKLKSILKTNIYHIKKKL